MASKGLEFVKMESAGNDFMVMDATENGFVPSAAQVQAWCHRHFGVGADGLVLLTRTKAGEFQMRIFNSDGTEAESCGNGTSCLGRLIFDRYGKKEFVLVTRGGKVYPKIHSGKAIKVEVDMGQPVLDAAKIPVLRKSASKGALFTLKVGQEKLKVGCVSMGNPHCLIVSPLSRERFFSLAPKIEQHRLFPKKTNVHLLKVLNAKNIELLIWERGAGPTLSCGTGACAAAVLASLQKWVSSTITVHMPGGQIQVTYNGQKVAMTTTPRYTFWGKLGL